MLLDWALHFTLWTVLGLGSGYLGYKTGDLPSEVAKKLEEKKEKKEIAEANKILEANENA